MRIIVGAKYPHDAADFTGLGAAMQEDHDAAHSLRLTVPHYWLAEIIQDDQLSLEAWRLDDSVTVGGWLVNGYSALWNEMRYGKQPTVEFDEVKGKHVIVLPTGERVDFILESQTTPEGKSFTCVQGAEWEDTRFACALHALTQDTPYLAAGAVIGGVVAWKHREIEQAIQEALRAR